MRNIFFPTTIIDGFFDDPDAIRDFALKQEFVYGKTHPGKWSVPIESTNTLIFSTIKSKFLDIFFSTRENIICDCSMNFQIIDETYESGWIHRDKTTATAIIYLSKKYVQNTGTSIYRKKDLSIDNCIDKQLVQNKWELMSNKDGLKSAREKVNSCYEEIIKIEGLYNRAIFFDGGLYHSAQNYSGNTNENSRLTLVAFFNKINCYSDEFPIQRMQRKSITII